MTKAFLHLLMATALLLPGVVFLSNTGDLTYYLRRPAPPGQLPYVLSRLFGLYALALIWLQVLLGALRPDLERSLGYHKLVRLHTTLGVATLAVLLGHVALFQTGVAMRSGHFPAPNLVPNYFTHYYASRIALGATALYLALAAGLAAGLRRQRWMRHIWRKLHALNYLAFALAAWHGLAIGSETRLQPLQGLCAAFVATIALAVLWRIHRGRASGAPAPAAP
jgi:predicted ferric reductase